MMIRPEHLIVKPLGKSPPKSALVGTVQDLSYLGTDTQLHVRIDDSISLLARVQNDAGKDGALTQGQPVQIDMNLNAIRMLDR